MGDHSPRSPSFPAKCARCGGGLSGPVFSFCPHCGAPARLAFADHVSPKKPEVVATAGADGAGADVPLGELLWPSRPTPLFDIADKDPYVDVCPSSRGSARHWGGKAGTALTALAFVILYSAAVLFHRHDNSTREEQVASRIAQGSVMALGVNPSKQAPTTTLGPTTTASASPSLPGPPPAVAPQPAQPSTSRAQNASASLADSTLIGNQYGDKKHRLMALALARAHSGLDKNDLRMARSGVYWALSLEPNNSEAIKLKQDLLLRERNHLQQ